MEEPLFISVVVPTCNRPKMLLNCIESIRADSYPHYEVIVVDQSLDDKTEKQIKDKFNDDSRIVYLHSDIKCSSDSRNKGWQKAKGNIIAFTDDDAIVGDGWLEAYAKAFNRENLRIGMAGGRILPIFQIPRPSWLPPEKDYLLPSFDIGDETKPFPEESLPISVNFALWKSILEEIGGFDTRLGLKGLKNDANISYLNLIGGEDSYVGIRVRNSGYSIVYLPSAVVYHPVTAERLTKKYFIKRNFREGATTIAIENVKKTCSKQKLSSYINWYLKKIRFDSLLFCRNFLLPKKGWSKIYMLGAANIAFSIGVIRYSMYLKKKQPLQD